MTSEPQEAYAWTWQPGATQPVVAGRLYREGDRVLFNYGRSYLARGGMPIYLPELPLRAGAIEPLAGLSIAGCLADAGPDAWGQRVIMNRVVGVGAGDTDPGALGRLTYLLESGSDRIGALDFQASPETYVPRRVDTAPLSQLVHAAERLERGEPFEADLDQALVHGSSVGGARPKALVNDGDRKLIAKFSSSGDPFPVVRGEFVAMELARRAGIDAARVELIDSLGKDVLLVERFDREAGGARRALVSALTILGLDEMHARYASYADLADLVRGRFTNPRPTLHELFARITFNVLVGNNDDHARNHAAFWDGRALTLTPAYDICPQARAGGETAQAMMIRHDRFRLSQLAGCVAAAPTYGLTATEGRGIIDHQIDVIRSDWAEVADLGRLTETERQYFWRRQFLNPFALEGYSRA
jgi:serine/threonine-protein kinase HipA